MSRLILFDIDDEQDDEYLEEKPRKRRSTKKKKPEADYVEEEADEEMDEDDSFQVRTGKILVSVRASPAALCCVLEQDTLIPAYYWLNPERTKND